MTTDRDHIIARTISTPQGQYLLNNYPDFIAYCSSLDLGHLMRLSRITNSSVFDNVTLSSIFSNLDMLVRNPLIDIALDEYENQVNNHPAGGAGYDLAGEERSGFVDRLNFRTSATSASVTHRR
jgi:hypothetical protein